jgi:hypothetical protein
MQMTRFEFMSPEWIAMARERIVNALAAADLGHARFTLCEEFTNPPAHLRREEEDTIGFCVRIDRGVVDVVDRPTSRADVIITSDYADALAIARDPEVAGADPAVMAERIADGRLTIEGDPSTAPAALRELDLHKMLAVHTA